MIPITKPNLGLEEVEAVKKVIVSGWIVQGPKVQEFENQFAQYTKAKHACAVSNCTTGLHLALLAVGVKPGDAVVTVSHSFIATANSIRYCGAEPIFVDVDLDTYNICVCDLEKVLKRNKARVSAILVVHQMGMPCELAPILKLAKKYKLPVVEDAACAAGSEYSHDGGKTFEKIGRPHGDIACFSFHPRKVLVTGEGGMLTTNNAKYDAKFRLLRHQGMSISDLKRHQSKKIIFETYPELGYNYRMTDIQAALGIEQLKKLDGMISRRRELASIYLNSLKDISWLALPIEPAHCHSNWQSFAVRVLKNAPLKRNRLMQHLLDQGIATRPGIMNAHQEKVYKNKKWLLENSQTARDTAIILPLYHHMTQDEIEKVIEVIKNV